jgi:2'-phosphotransferase
MMLIEKAKEIPIVIHGTNQTAWKSIRTEGLSAMKRQHIHFAVGLLGEEGVKSGMRKNCTVFIYIDTAKAMADGIQFFRSANNVILSSGIEGVIPVEYFGKILDNQANPLGG